MEKFNTVAVDENGPVIKVNDKLTFPQLCDLAEKMIAGGFEMNDKTAKLGKLVFQRHQQPQDTHMDAIFECIST